MALPILSQQQPNQGAINGGTFAGLLQSASMANSVIDRAADSKSRTADNLARMGALIYQRNEENKIREEAAYLSPIKSLLSARGMRKLATGDQDGWGFISGAMGVGAGNPLLERMNNDITGAAQSANASFIQTALQAQSQSFQRELFNLETDRRKQELGMQIGAGRFTRTGPAPKQGYTPEEIQMIANGQTPPARLPAVQAAQEGGGEVVDETVVEGGSEGAFGETIKLSDGAEGDKLQIKALLDAGSVADEDLDMANAFVYGQGDTSGLPTQGEGESATPEGAGLTGETVTPGSTTDAPAVDAPPVPVAIPVSKDGKPPTFKQEFEAAPNWSDKAAVLANPNINASVPDWNSAAESIPGFETSNLQTSQAKVAGSLVAVQMPKEGGKVTMNLPMQGGGTSSVTPASNYPADKVKMAQDGLALIATDSAELALNKEIESLLAETGGLRGRVATPQVTKDFNGKEYLQFFREVQGELLPVGQPQDIKYLDNIKNIQRGYAMVDDSGLPKIENQMQPIEAAKVLPKWVADLPEEEMDKYIGAAREFASMKLPTSKNAPERPAFTRDEIYSTMQSFRTEELEFGPEQSAAFDKQMQKTYMDRVKAGNPELAKEIESKAKSGQDAAITAAKLETLNAIKNDRLSGNGAMQKLSKLSLTGELMRQIERLPEAQEKGRSFMKPVFSAVETWLEKLNPKTIEEVDAEIEMLRQGSGNK